MAVFRIWLKIQKITEMRMPPSSVLAGWHPNYTDPVTHGPAILIVNIIFITIVMIAVIGRFYSRIFIKKWLGSDDYLCLLALVSVVIS